MSISQNINFNIENIENYDNVFSVFDGFNINSRSVISVRSILVRSKHKDIDDKDADIQELVSEFKSAIRGGRETTRVFARKLLDRDFEPAKALHSFEMAALSSKPPYPLWEDRPIKRGTNPAQWILKHHSDLVGTEGARAAIGRRDPQLIQHYAVWISPERHPEDDLKLDTRESIDLNDLTAAEILDRRRSQVRESKQRKSIHGM